MALVAIAMVAIIAIAALSVDVVTLLLAREEAQRAADAGALAAARVISISGLTGDTTNSSHTWECICGTNCTTGGTTTSGFATLAAQMAAGQSTVSGAGGNSTTNFSSTVTYSAGGGSAPDCTNLANPGDFAVNPMVTVQVRRTSLPTFFSRMWGNTGNTVSASATAEAFNPSFSGTYANQGSAGTIIPVQPRCVKPLIVANRDPLYPQPGKSGYCTGPAGCSEFVSTLDGTIVHPGVSLDGTGASGVIGENFLLIPDCNYGVPGTCQSTENPPWANMGITTGRPHNIPSQPNLQYLPGQALYASVAVPTAAAAGNLFERAIAGCDQTTVYQCGVENSAANPQSAVDWNENPVHPRGAGDTAKGVMALIHQGVGTTALPPDGQDYFSTPTQFTSAPYQILAGTRNPILGSGFTTGTPLSTSNSIVTLPIMDIPAISNSGTAPVTIVGFLQVFINGVDQYGNVNVTVLNVAGCSNGVVGDTFPVSSNAVTGSSPVPVRLITPPTP